MKVAKSLSMENWKDSFEIISPVLFLLGVKLLIYLGYGEVVIWTCNPMTWVIVGWTCVGLYFVILGIISLTCITIGSLKKLISWLRI